MFSCTQVDALCADAHLAAHDVVVGDEQDAPRARENRPIAHEGVDLVEDVSQYEGEADGVGDDDGHGPGELSSKERVEEVGDGVGAADRVRGLHLHLR